MLEREKNKMVRTKKEKHGNTIQEVCCNAVKNVLVVSIYCLYLKPQHERFSIDFAKVKTRKNKLKFFMCDIHKKKNEYTGKGEGVWRDQENILA